MTPTRPVALFLITVAVTCLNARLADCTSFFSRLSGDNKRFDTAARSSNRVLSALSCARDCDRHHKCKAFNLFRGGPNEVLCELLERTPVIPSAQLRENDGWSYYEKTCPSSLRVVLARDGPVNEVTMEESQLSAYLGDGRSRYYAAIFNADLTLASVQYVESLKARAQGRYVGVDSVANVKVGNATGVNLTFAIRGNNMVALLRGEALAGFPKDLHQLGAQGVQALLPSESAAELYAFRHGQVLTLAVNFTAPDSLSLTVKDIQRLGVGETHRWYQAPSDVIAAAWIRSRSLYFGAVQYALLVSVEYYVVLDANTETVVARGRFCGS